MAFTQELVRDIATGCEAPTDDAVLDGLFDAYNGSKVEDTPYYYRFLYRLSRRCPGLTMVELGCKYGAASLHFLVGGGRKAVGIDCGDVVRRDLFAFEGLDFTFVLSRSTDPAALAAAVDFQPDIILVDTDHTHGTTREETRLWTPRLKPGGLMLYDDVQAEDALGRKDFGCGTAFKEVPGGFYLNHLHAGGWGFGCWIKPL